MESAWIEEAIERSLGGKTALGCWHFPLCLADRWGQEFLIQNLFSSGQLTGQKKIKNVDVLSEKLFSGHHLNVILQDPVFFHRFSTFLHRYKPQLHALLREYMEIQKAYKAIQYANAVSEMVKIKPQKQEQDSQRAAFMNPAFEAKARESFNTLVTEALPVYIVNVFTQVTTEYMVREIMGTSVPIMRELVTGLAEVFVLCDPKIEDCPIVLASEEFYRTSRYSYDNVIGHNCRFLQGPKSNQLTVSRLKHAVETGQQCNEAILNYRRDGQAFLNLLLIAPLHDNRGNIKYFIGAQIDISGLVEDGRGLDSFDALLSQGKRPQSINSSATSDSKQVRRLKELAQSLSRDEYSLVMQQDYPHMSLERSRSSGDTSSTKTDNPSSLLSIPQHSTSSRSPSHPSRRERVVLNPDPPPSSPSPSSPLNQDLPPPSSGKLPGVYQNYLLVRPYPSMRITFVSPSLRIPGLMQSLLLDHILRPEPVKRGLEMAFMNGKAVTAKLVWSSSAGSSGGGGGTEKGGGAAGLGGGEKTRYLSCTPLLGADNRVGVWMVVMVEDEFITGGLNQGSSVDGIGSEAKWLRSGSGADGVGGKRDEYAEFMRQSEQDVDGVDQDGRTVDGV